MRPYFWKCPTVAGVPSITVYIVPTAADVPIVPGALDVADHPSVVDVPKAADVSAAAGIPATADVPAIAGSLYSQKSNVSHLATAGSLQVL